MMIVSGANDMKPLVVYYSRTGIGNKVTEVIADVLKCAIEEV
jgi:flavodoxin